MTEQWSLPAWAVVAAVATLLVGVLLVLGLLLALRRARRERARTATTTEQLRGRVEAMERRLGDPDAREDAAGSVSPRGARAEFLITDVGAGPASPDPARSAARAEGRAPVDGALFADLVLRESVVQAASWAAGVRRALSPETRHRVRLEVRRDLKRSRKQRRTDLRAARRLREERERRVRDGADEAGTSSKSSAA